MSKLILPVDYFLMQITQGIEEGKDVPYFEEIYRRFFVGQSFTAAASGNEILFRGRTDIGRLFTSVNELKYPPANAVKERGRFNDINESLTYLSFVLYTIPLELNVRLYQPFCILKSNLTDHRDLLFWDIGLKEKKEKGLSWTENKLRNYFTKLITSPDKRNYNATIALAHQLLNLDIRTPSLHKQFIGGIVYNSARESSMNIPLTNAVTKPDVFDKYFKPLEALYFMLTFVNDTKPYILVSVLNRGQVLANNDIQWNLSYDKMIQECKDKYEHDAFLLYSQTKTTGIIKYDGGFGDIIGEDDTSYLVKFPNINDIQKVSKDIVQDTVK